MKLTSREKLLVGILLACIILYGEYTYIISGQLNRIQSIRNENAQLQIKLDQLNAAKETEKQLNSQIDQSMKVLSTVMDQYFSNTEQEDFILLMTDFLTNSNVNLNGLTFTAPTEAPVNEIPFTKSTIAMEIESSYESADALLKKIWKFPKMLAVESVTLTKNETGSLNGSIGLGVYYLAGYQGTGYKDNLYQIITDEAFFKTNPFVQSGGASDYRLNYVYTGGKDPSAAAYVPFTDITGHWLEKEINDFGEKGFIVKGQATTFGPDAPMTRGEFIIMTDRIYQWPVPEAKVDLTKFTDYSNLGSYENAIAKAVFKGYLGGYVVGFEDNTLRPRDPITYEEVEFIMQKIKNDPSFKWDTVAQRLQNDKAFTSVGLANKKGLMTKAESVFLLTHFQ